MNMQTLTTVAQYAAYVVSGLVVILNAIAPLTKSDLDNKALSALKWFQDTVLKLVLPAHDVTLNAALKDPAAK